MLVSMVLEIKNKKINVVLKSTTSIQCKRY